MESITAVAVGVQYLYTLGILSIVDVHQDGFSRYLVGGCGDGFPLWAIPRRYSRQLSIPNNGVECKNWRVNLVFDTAVSGTWQAFYNNENGVRDAFLSLWDTLSCGYPA
jgi:endoglycosylceramidase